MVKKPFSRMVAQIFIGVNIGFDFKLVFIYDFMIRYDGACAVYSVLWNNYPGNISRGPAFLSMKGS